MPSIVSAAEIDLLFVYGTLMGHSAHPMARRLRQGARLVGPASMQGCLYDLGSYPAAVGSADPRERVHGEVYAMTAPAVLLPQLDLYEGCAEASPRPHLYARALVPVRFEDGAERPAWTYLYGRNLARHRPIPDGRWRPPRRR